DHAADAPKFLLDPPETTRAERRLLHRSLAPGGRPALPAGPSRQAFPLPLIVTARGRMATSGPSHPSRWEEPKPPLHTRRRAPKVLQRSARGLEDRGLVA